MSVDCGEFVWRLKKLPKIVAKILAENGEKRKTVLPQRELCDFFWRVYTIKVGIIIDCFLTVEQIVKIPRESLHCLGKKNTKKTSIFSLAPSVSTALPNKFLVPKPLKKQQQCRNLPKRLLSFFY